MMLGGGVFLNDAGVACGARGGGGLDAGRGTCWEVAGVNNAGVSVGCCHGGAAG